MKILKLETSADFSEVAIEQAIQDIHKEINIRPVNLILNISVFDIDGALSMMIDQKYFNPVRYVHITPEFKEGEFSLEDDLNNVILHSHCMM